MNKAIVIVAPQITNRLIFTLDWLMKEQLGIDYKIVTERPLDSEFPLIIDYGNPVSNFCVPADQLLFNDRIENQKIETGFWNSMPVLFYNSNANTTVPFDIFAAIFYLISRYEEYQTYTPDKHDRYPFTDSILFQNKLLERPIVDEWVIAFSIELKKRGVATKQKSFQFIPSYDIDIAWKYKHKGLKRSIGSYFRDLIQFNFTEIIERTKALLGLKKDAYDSFETIVELAKNNTTKPIIFILAAQKNTSHDKNILPTNKSMADLISALSSNFIIGTHPSYRSNEVPSIFLEEKKILEKTIRSQLFLSRQHYIKFSLPTTYRHLISNGIKEDYSMGYGTALGFRAGTSNPFFWYDLKKEEATGLRIFPFCFMDTTAHYELKLNATAAFERLETMKNSIEKVGGTLITIFHNFSLGTSNEWRGWEKKYVEFYKKNIL